jgi:hypothetical protein
MRPLKHTNSLWITHKKAQKAQKSLLQLRSSWGFAKLTGRFQSERSFFVLFVPFCGWFPVVVFVANVKS